MKSAYTTYEVAQICNVTMRAVAKWVNSGKLLAFKTPGGHRRIKEDDLVSFLKQHNIPFPDELKDKGFRKILIVDDEKEVINLVTKLLKKIDANYKIYSAMNGFEAGKQASSLKPDLLILDLKLPGIDGFEVCKNVKKDPETKAIKILAITGYPSEEVKKKIINCGADDYLGKPFDIDDFAERVKKLLA